MRKCDIWWYFREKHQTHTSPIDEIAFGIRCIQAYYLIPFVCRQHAVEYLCVFLSIPNSISTCKIYTTMYGRLLDRKEKQMCFTPTNLPQNPYPTEHVRTHKKHPQTTAHMYKTTLSAIRVNLNGTKMPHESVFSMRCGRRRLRQNECVYGWKCKATHFVLQGARNK